MMIQQIESDMVKEVSKFTMTLFFVKGRKGILQKKFYSFESETKFRFFRTSATQFDLFNIFDFLIFMVKECDNIHK
jgi:hypothetical protein